MMLEVYRNLAHYAETIGDANVYSFESLHSAVIAREFLHSQDHILILYRLSVIHVEGMACIKASLIPEGPFLVTDP